MKEKVLEIIDAELTVINELYDDQIDSNGCYINEEKARKYTCVRLSLESIRKKIEKLEE